MSAFDRVFEKWQKSHPKASQQEKAAFKDGYMEAVIVVLNNEK
jgi:hypothetical protein